MNISHVSKAWFRRLGRRDFDNGAVLDEIAEALGQYRIGPKLREHLIEHLEAEVQWFEDMHIEGARCPECCKDLGEDHECLYRQAKRLLAELKGETHG